MTDISEIRPYDKNKPKKQQVSEMFNNIAPKYDFLNHLLSMGIDKIWRRKVINLIKPLKPKIILDVATGTGDLALALTQVNPDKIIGLDISPGMLEKAKIKTANKQLSNIIEYMEGDAENLPFEDNYFDVITVAFGVRNFETLNKGLKELRRVLKPNGKLFILEFSKPQNPIMRKLYFFYFYNVLPTIGKIVSKDSRAYTYLPESVSVFPDGNVFLGILKENGFKNLICKPLTFGISSIYTASK
jgi:demethylmenaquinone methyltransferase/2-methoxy-6-polyprenyl-1,4-benzoquinol methylase